MTILRALSRCLKSYVRPTTLRYYCTNELNIEKEEPDMAVEQNRIVWLDMEMTGLEPEVDHILEVACLVTDENCNIISTDFEIVINQPDLVLNSMGKWCKKQHKKSGLIAKSQKATCTVSQAEDDLLNFLKDYVTPDAQIAGNSIYIDRLFLRKHMQRAHKFFHYRIIDVSSIRELVRRWYPNKFKEIPKKSFSHRALDDIRESIQELNYYKQNVFKGSDL